MLLVVPLVSSTIRPLTSGLTGGIHPWPLCVALAGIYPAPPGMHTHAEDEAHWAGQISFPQPDWPRMADAWGCCGPDSPLRGPACWSLIWPK